MTKQRQAVAGVLYDAGGHLSAEDVFRLAKERLPSISRATVYNNLHAMEEEKSIRRITVDGADLYDRAYAPHPHLICDRCGRVEDLPLPWLDDRLTEALGERPTSYEFKIGYICPSCHEKEQKSKQ